MPEIRPRLRRRDAPVRVSPVDRMIASQDGDYYKLTEAAALVGVSVTTLRRALKRKGVTAPTYEAQMGSIYVYLYTPEDIVELKALFNIEPERRN